MNLEKTLGRYWPAIATALTSLIVSVFQDTIKQILKNIFGDTLSGLLYVLLAVGAAALVLFVIGRALRKAAPRTLRKDEQPPKKKGLILLVGPGRRDRKPDEAAAEPAIEYHRLDGEGTPVLRVCWLVASKEGFAYAAELRRHYQPLGIKIPDPIKVENPFNVSETFGVISEIYENELSKEGLREEEVIADLTGATKPMTVGMALACALDDRNRPMQYMLGGGYPDRPSEVMAVKFERRP